MATLFGTYLVQAVKRGDVRPLATDTRVAVYTFGSPRVGNKEFAKFVESKFAESKNSELLRIVGAGDLVTRYPRQQEVTKGWFNLLDYAH